MQADQIYSGAAFKERLQKAARRISGSSQKTPWMRNTSRHTKISVALVVALLGIATASYSFASTPPVTNISINGRNVGPAYDGIGAISGGGGNSRLLIDYPEPQRSQILDYLFKPDYGANLQMLKLEIGGDGNSSDGSEASMEHARGQINCNAGYEWWVAQQAVNRNPNIKLYGLQWAAPGWTGEGSKSIWTNSNVNYVIDWMNCAKSRGLNISYVGGWNERGYNANWYEALRSALNSYGFTSTQIVAADNISNPWGVASALSQNAAFKNAVGVVGVHDTCPVDPTTGYSCTATTVARNLGLPLWQSEIGGMDANLGAADMARSINNGYNDAGITGYLEWPLIDAMPSGLPYENRGLVYADQPWSGNYQVNLMTWAIAQTTQFVQPGWVHVGGANKTIGNSGTYNTYESPNHADWSLVAENTSSYTSQVVDPQTINVAVSNLPNTVVHVWQTNLWIHSSSPQWFAKLADIHPVNGRFTYVIQPGDIVTFTTTTGQSKGSTSAPAWKALSLPYANSLSTNDGSNEPAYLSPQDGSFELAPCLGGLSGSCTEQTTPQQPVLWAGSNTTTSYPYAIIGYNWQNYTVSTRLLFQHTNSSGGVVGRFSNRSGDIGNFNGYLLHVTEGGTWQILKNNATNSPSAPNVLASGSVGSLGLDKWHNVALSLNGSTLSALIDGRSVGSARDTAYVGGPAGIESDAFTSYWSNNQYEGLTVSPISTTPSANTVSFTSGAAAGKCLDDYQDGTGRTGSPNKVDIFTCNSSAAQQWTPSSGGTLQIHGQCLDVYKAGTSDGDKVDLFSCNGKSNQVWHRTGDTIVNPASGKCLDDPNASTTNGTQLQIWKCNGLKNQVWHES